MIDIHKTLEHASKLKIAVIGDLIEDKYVLGEVTRVSPEAPVPVLNYKEHKTCLGGAGNVFMNLYNLGVDVHLFCNFDGQPDVEDDALSRIFCNQHPHAVKTRFMAGQHHLLRVDKEVAYDQIGWKPFNSFAWWGYLQEHFAEYDRIVLVDYHKGVLSDSLINGVMELVQKYDTYGRRNIPVIVDAKRDFHRFKGAYMLKCNEKESAGFWRSDFAQKNEIILIVTLGSAGISWYNSTGTASGIEGLPIQMVDVCGAGDTVTAILAITQGNDLNDICQLANIAASEVCKYSGVTPITKDMLITRFNEVHLRLSIDEVHGK